MCWSSPLDIEALLVEDVLSAIPLVTVETAAGVSCRTMIDSLYDRNLQSPQNISYNHLPQGDAITIIEVATSLPASMLA